MSILLQLALVLSLSCLFGYLVHRLKLPLVVAYLLAGVSLSLTRTVAQFGIGGVDANTLGIFRFLPDIGIAFVLFLIGMELDLRELKSLSKPILISSLIQSSLSAFVGYNMAYFLGFSQTESILMGLGLSFSSTVVIIKLLSERHDSASLHGKLSIGILLVEDLLAILVLMAITLSGNLFSPGGFDSLSLVQLLLKALGLFFLSFIFARYILERIFDEVANSVELLFLNAITWCFIFTSISLALGFSVVIGAFLAGVALASSPYRFQIQGKVKPLRDFFVTLFFVYLGSQGNILDVLTPQALAAILIFTFYALLIKPTIFLFLLSLFGFRKHTLFRTSLNLSQISEFSLIILLLGVQQGLISQTTLSVMSAVAVISVILSSILVTFSKRIYPLVNPLVSLLEHKGNIHFMEAKSNGELLDHVVVIGAHRVGGPVIKYLNREKIPFIVMDFNPHIVQELREQEFNVLYGDVGDPEILDHLQLDKAKLIISTAQDEGDNELLLEEIKRRKIKAKVVARAQDREHAEKLKNLGADYVILPEQVSGDFLVSQLKNNWPEVHFRGL